MTQIKVTCEIGSYDNPAKTRILIHSHWHRNDMIEIEIGDEKRMVQGNDVIEAVRNAMNTNRF